MPRPQEKAPPVMVGFSVPKKKFRSSVHRHRVRRLMFEAWRLNKHTLYAAVPPTMQLHVFLIFNSAEMPEYSVVEQAVVKAMEWLTEIAATLTHA